VGVGVGVDGYVGGQVDGWMGWDAYRMLEPSCGELPEHRMRRMLFVLTTQLCAAEAKSNSASESPGDG